MAGGAYIKLQNNSGITCFLMMICVPFNLQNHIFYGNPDFQ